VVLVSPVLDLKFNSMKKLKNSKTQKNLKKGVSGLGVGERLQRPRIFCIISGIPEMMLSYGASDVRLMFA
jgi:hypothetical protein